jgi:hypothetical protein
MIDEALEFPLAVLLAPHRIVGMPAPEAAVCAQSALIVPARLLWLADLLFGIGELASDDPVCHLATVTFVFVTLAAISRDHLPVVGLQVPCPFTVLALPQQALCHTFHLSSIIECTRHHDQAHCASLLR